MTLNPGEVIVNRYKIVKKLGEGGFGAVYLAEDLNLKGKLVALKENKTDPANSALLAQSQAQFEREALILSNLSHPNLPRVTDYQTLSSGMQFLVMDYIPGESLDTKVNRDGPISEKVALEIISQILDALIYMHSQTPPVIHRDIKPANIVVSQEGKAFLVDFGISKTTATLSGARAVSTNYSPPEQYGSGTDPRSDIYSIGATLFYVLSGQWPTDCLARIVGDVFITPSEINPQITISDRTERVTLKAMELRLDDRYQSAQTMKSELLSSPKEFNKITVSKESTSPYQSISKALSSISEGGEIHILPGVYRENVVITKDVVLVSDGIPHSVIIEAIDKDPAIIVSNGKINCIGINACATTQPQCIKLNGGTIVFSNCDFSGGLEEVILVKSCELRVSTCSIHNGKGKGIHIQAIKSVDISHSEIFDNKREGVLIDSRSSIRMTQCVFHHNGSAGLWINGSGASLFANCEFRNNGNHGIQICDKSKPSFSQCVSRNNGKSGVSCSEASQPSFDGCHFIENTKDGIYIIGEAAPVIKKCLIQKNNRNGLSSLGTGKPIIESCIINGNKEKNLLIYDSSSPLITQTQTDF